MNRIRREICQALQEADYGLTQRELVEATGYSRPTIQGETASMATENRIKILEKGSSKIHLLPSEVTGSEA